jgi:3-hydroxybutyryl-CoA dehydrogenase
MEMDKNVTKAFDATRPDLVLGIVGTGIMGRGIAQIAVTAGCEVLLCDAKPGAAEQARDYVAKMLGKLAEKGKLDQPALQAAIARLKVVDGIEGLKRCHVVVEAIVENIQAKQSLLASLEAHVADDCIIATNTSSLAVTSIAAGCRIPGRVAGFHFFNPVPLMKIVEVIAGVITKPWVTDGLVALANRIGHTPVRAKDTPGFIVNHAGRGYAPEALRIAGEGVADFHVIDAILRDAAGFRMGPFELLDLTGLDVSYPAMESIYEQYYQEPRYRPSPIARQRVAAGLLGRKTGRGFYTYENDRMVLPPAEPAEEKPGRRPVSVWVAPGADDLAGLVMRLGTVPERGASPSADALCLIAPMGNDATAETIRLGLDARRVVAVDTLFGLDRRRTLMTTPITDPVFRDAAAGLLSSDGVPATIIHDSAGFVTQRIVANIVNVGCDIAQQRIATPQDIDRAVMLGLAYPAGPLAWGDRLGPARLLGVLEAMLAVTGDPRYRPSLWLRRRAMLGVSLLTPEG